MNRTMRTIALCALVVAAVVAPVFGQGLLPSKVWILTINVNVPNASIYVDNALVQGNSVKVSGGPHVIRVHADGYTDITQSITVKDNMTFGVRLNAQLYPLTIRVTAPNASVFVDGNNVTGSTPSVMLGTHTIQVTAPGFLDYTSVINVSGPFALDVALQQAGFSLIINVNVPNASIYVDNTLLNGNVARVTAGQHAIRVHADGYADVTQSLTVRDNMTYDVRLNAQLFPVNIRVRTPNASVFIDGNNVTGTIPAVAMGSHTVQVTAPGYQDYTSVINVSAPVSLDVSLQQAGFLLTVNSNVGNATVMVNNMAKGAVPYSEYLPQGTYTVRVSAAGFSDYTASVVLDRALTINAPLQQMSSTLTFVIPDSFRDPGMKPGDPNDVVRIYIDGRHVNPNRELSRIVINPGRHRIRISSGSFSMQLDDLTVQTGVSYII
jgi:phage tail tube protein FII